MTPLRRQALDSIGFVWQVRAYRQSHKYDQKWNEKFRLLREYHTEHGDCLVPLDYVSANSTIMLGRWVLRQRVIQAAGKLPQDRLNRLESLGFSFRALPDFSNQANWDRRFEKLVRYKRQHGDCRVPQAYKADRQLGIWVNNLRKRRDTLSSHERAQLDGIDFCWDAGESRWQDMFEELQRFKLQHGHCVVTRQTQHHSKLYGWVLTQRASCRRNLLDARRKKQLDSIGFCWRPRVGGRRPREENMMRQSLT
jgi:hypothetical protein